jgi:hypothetical protein
VCVPLTPTSSQLDGLPAYLKQVLDQVHEMMGFQFSVYCGGYDENGQVAVYRYIVTHKHLSIVLTSPSVHSGTCDGPFPSTFASFVGHELDSTIERKFKEFILYKGAFICCSEQLGSSKNETQ